MDIIDIMLAKAMTPQGQTDIYVNKANKAAAKAEQAESDAAAAIALVTNASETISEAQEAAADLLATAQEALEVAQEAQINTLDTEDVDAEVKKMTVNTNTVNGNAANTLQIVTTYPDNTLNTQNITKLYKSTGSNEDGTMTQKAISDVLNSKADASTAATKQYVDAAIAAIPAGGGSGGSGTNIGDEGAGHVVVVDDQGNVVAGDTTEADIIEALIKAGTYTLANTVGLDIDYANRTFTRIQESKNYTMGNDFNKYSMYGGRVKCNVADDGTINAFYGQAGYIEDGTNGQVMIYQPKFYYKRIILEADNITVGKAVRHELLLISQYQQPGFKLAPIFTGNLDYVLLPAYDASLINNVNIDAAEDYANARGQGWHIMNMAAESANQMLEMIEFGTLNGQEAIEYGIINIPSGSNGNCLFITGSTSSLGNGTGHAESTSVNINGNISTLSENGYRAIAYRGMENPWGNLWSMIGGINIHGNHSQDGGLPYICTNFNYNSNSIENNYVDAGFSLPNKIGWVNAMGYGKEEYDWVYIPSECGSGANSWRPIGDGIWTIKDLNNTMSLATGGSFGYSDECGPFYYAADREATSTARTNYGAKLLFIPTKNTIYTNNITKWTNYIGG